MQAMEEVERCLEHEYGDFKAKLFRVLNEKLRNEEPFLPVFVMLVDWYCGTAKDWANDKFAKYRDVFNRNEMYEIMKLVLDKAHEDNLDDFRRRWRTLKSMLEKEDEGLTEAFATELVDPNFGIPSVVVVLVARLLYRVLYRGKAKQVDGCTDVLKLIFEKCPEHLKESIRDQIKFHEEGPDKDLYTEEDKLVSAEILWRLLETAGISEAGTQIGNLGAVLVTLLVNDRITAEEIFKKDPNVPPLTDFPLAERLFSKQVKSQCDEPSQEMSGIVSQLWNALCENSVLKNAVYLDTHNLCSLLKVVYWILTRFKCKLEQKNNIQECLVNLLRSTDNRSEVGGMRQWNILYLLRTMKAIPDVSKDDFFGILDNVFRARSESDTGMAIRVWTFLAFFDSLEGALKSEEIRQELSKRDLRDLFDDVWKAANCYYCHDLKLRQKLDHLRGLFNMISEIDSKAFELPKFGVFTKLTEIPTFFRYIAWRRYLLDNDFDEICDDDLGGISDDDLDLIRGGYFCKLPVKEDPLEIIENMDSFFVCISSRDSSSFVDLTKPVRRACKKWKCVRDYVLAYCEQEQTPIYNWHFPVLGLYVRLSSCKSSEDLSIVGRHLCELVEKLQDISTLPQHGFDAIGKFLSCFLSKVPPEQEWLEQLLEPFLKQHNTATGHTVLAACAKYIPEKVLAAFNKLIEQRGYSRQDLAWKIDTVGKICPNMREKLRDKLSDISTDECSSDYWDWFPLP